MSFINNQAITDLPTLRAKMPLFFSSQGSQDIYFRCPGIDTFQIQEALSAIGSNIPPPPFDDIDKSYSNLINYYDDNQPAPLKAALTNLIDYLEGSHTDPNIRTKFTDYINGDFRTNFYDALPSDQKAFFTQANLPTWQNPPTNLQEMEKNLKIWSGDNVFKNNFYNAVQSFIDDYHIQTLQDFQKQIKQIPNFLTDSDFRNIYFKYFLNQTELENAFTIMGGGIELPPMENLDISYTNLSNYLYNPPLPPSPLFDAVNNLVGVLSLDQKTLTEDQFTFYLNVQFRGTKIYKNIPPNQRGFFNINNIPEWQSDFQAVEYQLKAMFNDSKGGNIFYNNLLSFINNQAITDLPTLRAKMPLFFSSQGSQDIYFRCPGIDTLQIQVALSAIGSNIPPPPFDDIDKSYSNLINYYDDNQPAPLKAALTNLIDYLEGSHTDPNIRTKFTDYINGDFRTNFYDALSYDQKLFFTQDNLPTWRDSL